MKQTESRLIADSPRPTAPLRPIADAGSWKQMLAARLVPNAAARAEFDWEERVTIRVKTARPWYMVPPLSWIVPVRRDRAVMLDRLGAQVWRLCDGERTIEQVIDAFAASYRLSFHEARSAVTGYTKVLVRRGVLAIVLPRTPTTGPAGRGV